MVRSAFFWIFGAGLLVACASPAPSGLSDVLGTPGGAGGADAGAGGSEAAGSDGGEGGEAGSDAGAGGSDAGSGGSDAGSGGSDAGSGGSDAGAGGSTAGSGGSDAGAGGSVAGSGGSGAGVGGSAAGSGGSSAGGSSGGTGPLSQDSCCVAHDGPGCNDAAVQNCVCDQDPTCCSGSWNQLCVNEIQKFACGSCAGGAGGGGAGGAGGSVDPFGGAGGASGTGGGAGGSGPAPVFGGFCCNEQTTSPSCDIPEVVSCVCAKDSFCCEIEWDDQCSAEVKQFGCAVCEGGYTCSDYPPQCIDCCISAHPSGYDSFGSDVGECACNGACEFACLSACFGGEVSQGCADCLNSSLGSSCPTPTCDGNPDCAAYLSCANTCP